MLELRPNCECCNKDLLPHALDAVICSFECTFCYNCSQAVLNNTCPNCEGELVRRPTRTNAKLRQYPASAKRIHISHCSRGSQEV